MKLSNLIYPGILTNWIVYYFGTSINSGVPAPALALTPTPQWRKRVRSCTQNWRSTRRARWQKRSCMRQLWIGFLTPLQNIESMEEGYTYSDWVSKVLKMSFNQGRKVSSSLHCPVVSDPLWRPLLSWQNWSRAPQVWSLLHWCGPKHRGTTSAQPRSGIYLILIFLQIDECKMGGSILKIFLFVCCEDVFI